MKIVFMLGAFCLALGCLARAQAPAPNQRFESYRMVRTRNIFDPLRIAGSMSDDAAPARPEPTPPPKASDFVALTGVMITGDHALAFFSGSRPDYDRVIPVNSDIAGAKLTKITPAGVEVNRGGTAIVVGVGQTVPFDKSAPVSAGPSLINSAAAPRPATGSSSQSTNAPSGEANEIMRRMIERRQQELR